MIYIYDILVNFNKEKLLEFYEWNEDDNVINIKKIKLIKVKEKVLRDLIDNKCIINKDLLLNVYHSCELYNKNINKYEYACLISDGNIVVAFNFNKEGRILETSRLLLEEENEISILASNMEEYDLKYLIKEKNRQISFYTRNETIIYKYLSNEIKNSYNNKEYSKLKYLYQEYFDKDSTNDKNMCNELLNSLNKINFKHKELYNLLIKTKKQV